MKYFLNAEAFRVVGRNDKDRVNHRKRYKRGDEVDVSPLDEDRVAYLVERGHLVAREDDVETLADAGDISPVSPPFGAATDNSAGVHVPVGDYNAGQPTEGELDPGEPPSSTSPVTPVNADDAGGQVADVTPANPENLEGEATLVDEYDEMDYPTLQRTAKGRDLNAGGTADDIRDRLREADGSSE